MGAFMMTMTARAAAVVSDSQTLAYALWMCATLPCACSLLVVIFGLCVTQCNPY